MNTKYSLFIFSNNTNDYQELDVEEIQMINIFSLENIQDITTRKDNVTKELQLKGTPNNNIALGNIYDISTYSSDTYATDLQHNFIRNRSVRCSLLENNVEIVRGKLFITDIAVNKGNITYDCSIVGNQASFFGELADREITDLDSLNDTIPFTIAHIRDTWNNPNYRYLIPQLDFGIDERMSTWETVDGQDEEVIPEWWNNSYDFKNFRPAIKLKGYLDAIFRGFRYDTINKKYTQLDINGNPIKLYDYKIELEGNDDINKIFIPNNNEHLTKQVTGLLSTVTTPNTVINGITLPNWFNQLGSPTIIVTNFNASSANTTYFTSYEIPSGWTFFSYNNNGTKAKFTTKVPTKVLKTKDRYLKTKISIKMNLTLPKAWKGKYQVGLCDISARQVIDNVKFGQTINKTTTTSAQSYAINYQSDVVDVAGSYILVIRREDQSVTDTAVDTDLKFENVEIKFGDTNVTSDISYALNDNISLKDTLPKAIKIKDFLKSILTLFNLYIISDPDNSNGFLIKPYNRFYKDVLSIDRTKALDWTDKIDFENYNLMGNMNLPKAYKYTFTEDTDMLNEYYKQQTQKNVGNITVEDSQGLVGEKEIEVIFAPTLNLEHSLNTKKLACIYKQGEGFLQGKKKPFNSKLRILYHNGEITTEQYSIHHRGNEITKLSTYQYSSMFNVNPLSNEINETLLFELPQLYFTDTDKPNNYSIGLYERYHKQQLNNIIDNNIHIAEFTAYLNETDISDISNTFQKPIFIQSRYGNSYYKLLEVEYINSNTASRIKLMKIVTK
ncbi:hypothetical protein [Sphingobacterium mizutaii]|uniref:hypothetical protein n=1 Tax=Sphingobacterium mizutaii TaxID=1010 RepID=UPI001628183F|nr:hypothetical protein [Sphingobacterium mizutaii]